MRAIIRSCLRRRPDGIAPVDARATSIDGVRWVRRWRAVALRRRAATTAVAVRWRRCERVRDARCVRGADRGVQRRERVRRRDAGRERRVRRRADVAGCGRERVQVLEQGSCKFGARCNNKHVCSSADPRLSGGLFGGWRKRIPRDAGDGQELLSPGTSYAMVHSISAMPENLSKSVEGSRRRRTPAPISRRRRARREGSARRRRRVRSAERRRRPVERSVVAVVDSGRARRRRVRSAEAEGGAFGAPSSGARSGRRDDGRVRGAVDRWGVRWIAGGRWIRCERGESESVRWGVDDVRVRRFAEFGSERRFVRRRRRRGWVRCFRDAVCVRGTVHDGWIRSEFGHTGRIRIERAGGESVWGFDGDAGAFGAARRGRVRRHTDTGCVRCRANT